MKHSSERILRAAKEFRDAGEALIGLAKENESGDGDPLQIAADLCHIVTKTASLARLDHMIPALMREKDAQ